jgi:predicted nucleic acid-binding protein
MKDKRIFVDTNILIYAHDKDAGERYNIAKDKIKYLWQHPGLVVISIQVLQEFYVSLIKRNVSEEDSRITVEDYLAWDVIDNDRSLLIEGISIREKDQLSFWDALILTAAKRGHAEILWSEDFNSGQNYNGVIAMNPLTGS